MKHYYTPEQIAFLSENVKGHSNEELKNLFNHRFGLSLGTNQIKAAKHNRGLSSGLDGRFKKGNEPQNKGTKGLTGANCTSFKKGNKSWNYKLVGTERVNSDDYVDIKIADPNKWRAKHLLVWERANGLVPKGHVVIFGDGNRRNFELDNLILVTRGQLAILNKNNLIQDDAELTRTGIIVADIFQKIEKRKKAKYSKSNR